MFDIAVILFLILQATLFVLSFSKVRNSKKRFGFIYKWGLFFGAFVWEDLVVFSLFTFLTTLLVFLLRDIRFALLIFSVFWIVRTAGESLYFFLQQFIEPKYHPLDINWHFDGLRKLFGPISTHKGFVLAQVTFQVLCVIFISILILTLKFWNQIPSWF